ncbi:hypothetical protein LSAT2_020634 [Lamellibrachia satsuma]|nr:hypothetical protein LSAT2_020634 [Lamellibrachia satsuma]
MNVRYAPLPRTGAEGSEMWPNTECSEGMMESTMGNIQRQADEVKSSLDRLNDLLKQQMQLPQQMLVIKSMRAMLAKLRDHQHLLNTFTEQQVVDLKR